MPRFYKLLFQCNLNVTHRSCKDPEESCINDHYTNDHHTKVFSEIMEKFQGTVISRSPHCGHTIIQIFKLELSTGLGQSQVVTHCDRAEISDELGKHTQEKALTQASVWEGLANHICQVLLQAIDQFRSGQVGMVENMPIGRQTSQ